MGWFIFGCVVGAVTVTYGNLVMARRGMVQAYVGRRLVWLPLTSYLELLRHVADENGGLEALLKDIKGL